MSSGPLQPLSPDLQPPLPLQEFCPLQACFSVLESSKFDEAERPRARLTLLVPALLELLDVDAARVVVAPVNSPDMAAVINRDFMVALVIGMFLSKTGSVG